MMIGLEAKLLQRQINPAGVINTRQLHRYDVALQTQIDRLMQRLKLPEQLLRRYTGGVLQPEAIAQRFNLRRVETTDWAQFPEVEWRSRSLSGIEPSLLSQPVVSATRLFPTDVNQTSIPLPVSSIRADSAETRLVIKPFSLESSKPSAKPIPTVPIPAIPIPIGELAVIPSSPKLLSDPTTVDSPPTFRIRRAVSRSTEAQPSKDSAPTPFPDSKQNALPLGRAASQIPQGSLPLRQETSTQNLVGSQSTASSQKDSTSSSSSGSEQNALPLVRLSQPFQETDTPATTMPLKVKPLPIREISRSITATGLISRATPRSQESLLTSVEQNPILPLIKVQPNLPPTGEINTSPPALKQIQRGGSIPAESGAIDALPLVMSSAQSTTGDRSPEAPSPALGTVPDPIASTALAHLPKAINPVNIEKVAEQVSRLLSRRLTIERERRGIRS